MVIHKASARKAKPLVTLECAGLTDTLVETELFGHVKGAFTGAHSDKKGLAAHGGDEDAVAEILGISIRSLYRKLKH